MLPCWKCAYRAEVPGSAHSRCVFAWPSADTMPKGNPHGIMHGWYIFPLNYDPTWGPSECENFAKERDPAKIAASHPLLDMISIMGRRFGA